MSPPRVEPSSVLGKDVVAEDDDLQLLEALRKQVQLRSAARYNAAADIAANNSGVDAADRAYQSMLMNRGEGGGGYSWSRSAAVLLCDLAVVVALDVTGRRGHM